ncbi:hypothetical protein UFOVP449_198 [uncultured Caudovirales phage]|uniref:Uncharacterized protein n=1 Tax=uncultured Caudovirales phage TaxID=2100421 RepID=A0A6J5MCE8_9CAUD|nr:hypothetical protein UFOVP449_198 [uncultured Caudovirales phage]
MNPKLKIMLNVIVFTSIIGLALSYLTTLVPWFYQLNFLEAIGVYCLWTPLHHAIVSLTEKKDLEN